MPMVVTHEPRTGVYYWPTPTHLHDRSNIELRSGYPWALQGLDGQQIALLNVNAQNQVTSATAIPWLYIAGGVALLVLLMK